MNDDVLTRFVDQFTSSADPQPVEEESEENAGSFGFLRGARERALMLEFRLKDGSSVAFSYALLDRASFDRLDGIRLRFAGQEVHVKGQSLNHRSGSRARLFDAILRHKVTWIQESNRAELLQAPTGALFVDSIAVDQS
jgi:hypothetical protein